MLRTSRVFLLSVVSLSLAAGACQRNAGEPPPGAVASTTATSMLTNMPPGLGPANPHAGLPPGHPPPGAGGGGPMGMGAPAGPREPAPIVWDDPPGWERVEPSSRMRYAQYRLPRAPGDSADGEVVVITFGAGQGGDTQSNLERWWGQVQQADGRATRDVAERQEFDAGSFHVVLTDVAGRLGGAMMPGMPGPAPIERGRLTGAIVDTPQGAFFFKITGPDATVHAARPAFERMLRGIHAR